MQFLLVFLAVSIYVAHGVDGACTEDQAAQELQCHYETWTKEFDQLAINLTKLEKDDELIDIICKKWAKFEKCVPDCQPLAYDNAIKVSLLGCSSEFKDILVCTRRNKLMGETCYSKVAGKGKEVEINGISGITEYERADICPVQKCLAEEYSKHCGDKAHKLYEKYDRQQCFSDPI